MTKKIILITGTAVGLAWAMGLFLFAWKINNFPAVSLRKTDAIIALTGGRNRIAEAVRLLKQGLSERLFISGVNKDISLQNIKTAQKLDVAERFNIDIGHNASNTLENAEETQKWVAENHIKSIRLVTSNYHVFRSLVEFEEQNPDLEIILHPVYSENIEKKWWTSWQTFSLIFKEYNKFLYAYLRSRL